MDPKDEARQGDPNMGGPPSGAPTSDAPPTAGGPNQVVGSPAVPQPPAPPSVIHRAGDAHPGEANPAAAMTAPDGRPVVDTAQFLAEREFAEESGQYPTQGGQPPAGASDAASYSHATGDVGYARDEQGGRVHAP